ncbi:hypothetical protein [Advenella mimigardefordensis]|uniref:hypothetical protein n=1 Tax=Advenella mimigardefordensis TaxID=302406 RepID=UPI00046D479D|nr:hypothetical protein [Advenella mimigardefordensis]
MDAKKIIALMDIAQKAIDHHAASRRTAAAKRAYYDSCSEWKDDQGYDRFQKLDRNSEDWERMMTHAHSCLVEYRKAKKAEYNAKRRLTTAIRKAEVA